MTLLRAERCCIVHPTDFESRPTDFKSLSRLGGAFESADFSSEWWNVFEKSKISKERLLEITSRVNGNRPEVVTKSVTVSDYVEMRPEVAGTLLPLDIALRIAAIRETFEETGRFDSVIWL